MIQGTCGCRSASSTVVDPAHHGSGEFAVSVVSLSPLDFCLPGRGPLPTWSGPRRAVRDWRGLTADRADGAHFWTAEVHRCKGNSPWRRPASVCRDAEIATAGGCFQQAPANRPAAGAKALELRAALSLSALLAQDKQTPRTSYWRVLLLVQEGWTRSICQAKTCWRAATPCLVKRAIVSPRQSRRPLLSRPRLKETPNTLSKLHRTM